MPMPSTSSALPPTARRARAVRLVVATPLLGAALAAGCSRAAPAIDPRRSTLETTTPVPEACRAGEQVVAPTTRPYFEYQVETPARFLPDSAALRPGAWYPDAPVTGDSLAVQFIVDATGRPDLGSFRVVRAGSPGSAERAREAVATWRYAPARIGRCAVRQLVQTGVRRR